MSAYACEPHKGSEPGAGWNWALAAAQRNDVWVITRANNRAAIEATAAGLERTPTFVYVEAPSVARFWKRSGHGIRSYYILWQLVAHRAARRLHSEIGFDVVHHVTFANLWLPALARLPGVPFVLGPVGGGPRVPLRLFKEIGVGGVSVEVLRRMAQLASRLNPLVSLTWRHADIVLAQNEETRDALPGSVRARTHVRTNASVDTLPLEPANANRKQLVAVFAGRLVGWKGAGLAIRALHKAPRWQLRIIGSGPRRTMLQGLASSLGVADRVMFVPWLPHPRLLNELRKADALVMPSLREDAGFVAAEARAVGTDVIAFARAGAAAMAALDPLGFHLVPLRSVDESAARIAAALNKIEASSAPPSRAFSVGRIAIDIDRVYVEATREPVMVGAKAES